MDLPQQPDFQRLTQSLTSAVNQIALIPNLPTVSDSQTIVAQLQNITQQLAQQGEQLAQQREQSTTILNAVNIIRDDIADINIRLDAR